MQCSAVQCTYESRDEYMEGMQSMEKTDKLFAKAIDYFSHRYTIDRNGVSNR